MFTPEEIAAEEWRQIPAHPRYDVSNLGRVRNRAGRILRGSRNQRGYWQVQLAQRGPDCRPLVHVLVLEAFVGPRPTGMEGAHADDDKDDNRASRLRWATPVENAADHQRQRKVRPDDFQPLGQREPSPRVAAIIPLLGTAPDLHIARAHGVCQSHVTNLRNRMGIPVYRPRA